MTPFFHVPTRINALLAEAERWKGTPFHARAKIRGSGVDCINLAAALYEAAGVIERFQAPEYKMDEGLHAAKSRIEEYLDGQDWMERLDDLAGNMEMTIVGDLICIRLGRVSYHVGVKVNEQRFIHVYQGHEAGYCDVRDPTWAKRAETVFRPIET